MKKNKVYIEILENSELRNVVGGYNDPYGRKNAAFVA